MSTIAITDQLEFREAEFPLHAARLELVVDYSTDVPTAAQDRFLAASLRAFADRVEAGKAKHMMLEEGEAAPGDLAAKAAAWKVPESLHMKSGKAAHRFLLAAAALLKRGTTPTLTEIAEKAKLSMPPVYRFVDSTANVGSYLEPLIEVSKRGRAKVLDLTPLGHKVANRIQAGSLPS